MSRNAGKYPFLRTSPSSVWFVRAPENSIRELRIWGKSLCAYNTYKCGKRVEKGHPYTESPIDSWLLDLEYVRFSNGKKHGSPGNFHFDRTAPFVALATNDRRLSMLRHHHTCWGVKFPKYKMEETLLSKC